ncbi:ATP-dependent zinc protease [Reinekea marinisedimentorum]|uniref:Retropepsin-like aspartic endopeptidase domain-containing protein n=1 Tax=Reinekea marinisedimentorum TaxID=230495 RepID=A0A4R3I964_9GAMM|nr:ATP-dependent zinc protease [Reinekea marinisedimentorum]TCS42694.1 hypothetical protein BCF53_103364 [Reinekea marinisedimentorum]
MNSKEKIIVGAIEECGLPEFGIENLPVRIDTGAKTSSLHVDGIKQFRRDGSPWVSFNIHPNVHNVEETIACEAKVHDIRTIKSSNGSSDERFIVKTTLKLGEHSWTIQLSLTDRSEMTYLMLLGRQGMGRRILVDPSETFLVQNN